MKSFPTNFVIDFETMDTKSSAVVLSLAVTPFKQGELKTFEEYIADTFSYKLDTGSQITAGRTIGAYTMEWWDKQDKAAQAVLEPSADDVTLEYMLFDLDKKLRELGVGKETLVYCRGSSFDFPIMANICDQVSDAGAKEYNPAFFPCAFWNQRDIRSYISGLLCDITLTTNPLAEERITGFEKHNAIHDTAKGAFEIRFTEEMMQNDNFLEEYDSGLYTS